MQPNPDTVSPAAAFAPRRLYLDNAATSFPKPRAVTDAMVRYATELGASAGRGAYREAVETGNLIAECRRRLNRLFNGERPEHFVFTLNCSDALNLAIKGLVDGATGGRDRRRGGRPAGPRGLYAHRPQLDPPPAERAWRPAAGSPRPGARSTRPPGLVDPTTSAGRSGRTRGWSRSRTPAT
jgi:hypothetical protein